MGSWCGCPLLYTLLHASSRTKRFTLTISFVPNGWRGGRWDSRAGVSVGWEDVCLQHQRSSTASPPPWLPCSGKDPGSFLLELIVALRAACCTDHSNCPVRSWRAGRPVKTRARSGVRRAQGLAYETLDRFFNISKPRFPLP